MSFLTACYTCGSVSVPIRRHSLEGDTAVGFLLRLLLSPFTLPSAAIELERTRLLDILIDPCKPQRGH